MTTTTKATTLPGNACFQQCPVAMARKTQNTTTTQSPDDTPGLGTFEASVTELERLVEALESGDVTLEEALSKFERGVTLARQCQTMLKGAELRVDQLLADGDDERVEAFDAKLETDSTSAQTAAADRPPR